MRDLGSAMLGICVRLCAVLGLNKLIYIRLYQVDGGCIRYLY